MKRNLTDAEMVAEAAAAGEAVNLDRVAEVRRIVRLTLDDERATRSEAEMRAGLYRSCSTTRGRRNCLSALPPD